jgi:glycosyltransferase involved in cell wall biosynthesis
MPHYVLDTRTATPHFPGIGRYVTNLARALVPYLNADEHLTILHDPAYPFDLPSNTTLYTLAVDVSPFSPRQQWVIPRLLRRLNADVYHSAYYLMPYRSVVPTLLTLYDLIPILFPAHSTPRARLLFRKATILALRASRHCIAISEATRRDFLTHFHVTPPHIVAIPLAADPIFYPQPASAVEALRARYDLPKNFILYVGSNKPHKNLERLIEAWSQAAPTLPDVTLVIAGAWLAQHPEPRQRAEVLGIGDRIRWLGPVSGDTLPALYTAAMAFIFPSLYEGFGLPPLEAMACGTPVICSHTSSFPEVVGNAARLVDPLDVDAWSTAIESVALGAGQRRAMRTAGLAQAARFSWNATAQQTLTLYRQTWQQQ